MSPRSQGYLYVAITMCIWGGFTITSRLNAQWGISAWDITALRFALAFCILMPILLYKKDTAFLWKKEPFLLAMIGGVGYCLTSYSAFHYVPAAHAAIFLNGCLPLCTALAGLVLFKQPLDKHIWISLVIMLSAITAMSFLMYQETGVAFGFGDMLFFLSAIWWGVFTVLLRQWKLSAWHSMAGVAIWSAIVYVPIYLLFLPKNLTAPEPVHLMLQVVFHGIFVVIVATLTYVEAIKRLGAFKAGSIVTLAPFIAAILAVPLLGEPLSLAIICGLIGMAIGALQPWRWMGRQDSLEKQLEQQKKQS
ncbi:MULTISPECIES: DMT family transporter [unclassified Acinetobacter]|uniref:DMT family transporter n=1 Tax=unclassified Acinetobacter TaxID=196816 RepID=UPI0021B74BBE|nr:MULTISPECIES: DMT family transporter [unclassified Acinetobacter]MCT8088560.1 DMT family transporter [Acinetobacter sp. F_3_1]MCT8096716.1 DMT family transporter [Acinetobacter sp. C_3_1]MCT8099591.1 DMT family transporter [Acinetobacter sp. C_4_1]MCT8133559.1 DMT family transporter [Acinetobacter sp. T_3_1]